MHPKLFKNKHVIMYKIPYLYLFSLYSLKAKINIRPTHNFTQNNYE